MLIIYMPAGKNHKKHEKSHVSWYVLCFVSKDWNRCDFRFSPLRQVNFHQAVFQFRLCALVIDRNIHGDLTPEMAIGAFDTKVSWQRLRRRFAAV